MIIDYWLKIDHCNSTENSESSSRGLLTWRLLLISSTFSSWPIFLMLIIGILLIDLESSSDELLDLSSPKCCNYCLIKPSRFWCMFLSILTCFRISSSIFLTVRGDSKMMLNPELRHLFLTSSEIWADRATRMGTFRPNWRGQASGNFSWRFRYLQTCAIAFSELNVDDQAYSSSRFANCCHLSACYHLSNVR